MLCFAGHVIGMINDNGMPNVPIWDFSRQAGVDLFLDAHRELVATGLVDGTFADKSNERAFLRAADGKWYICEAPDGPMHHSWADACGQISETAAKQYNAGKDAVLKGLAGIYGKTGPLWFDLSSPFGNVCGRGGPCTLKRGNLTHEEWHAELVGALQTFVRIPNERVPWSFQPGPSLNQHSGAMRTVGSLVRATGVALALSPRAELRVLHAGGQQLPARPDRRGGHGVRLYARRRRQLSVGGRGGDDSRLQWPRGVKQRPCGSAAGLVGSAAWKPARAPRDVHGGTGDPQVCVRHRRDDEPEDQRGHGVVGLDTHLAKVQVP